MIAKMRVRVIAKMLPSPAPILESWMLRGRQMPLIAECCPQPMCLICAVAIMNVHNGTYMI